MNLKEKLQELRNKGTMGLDALFDEASECLKQHELSKVYSMSPTAPTHWHGKAAGIIFAIESLQSLKAALPDSASDDDAGKPQEAESGREADQLLIEPDPASLDDSKRCDRCQHWTHIDGTPGMGNCEARDSITGYYGICKHYVDK